MAAGEDVGVLVARLVADTEGLRRDMQRSQRLLASNTAKMNRSLAKVDKKIGSTLKMFRTLRTGIVGVAVAMAGRFVKGLVDAAGALQDTADRIGLNVERLQDMHYAARQFDVDTNVVDMALQRLSRRVGEAVQGKGELVETLRQYNIAVVDAWGKTRPLDAILGDLAETIQNAESDQERLRIAFKAFDSEGAALVNVLKQGRKGLQDFSREAGEAGRLTAEQAKRLRELRNALKNLWEDLKTGFLVTLAGAVELWDQFADAGLRAINLIGEALNRLGTALGGLFRPAIDEARMQIAEIRAELADLPEGPRGADRRTFLERRLAYLENVVANQGATGMEGAEGQPGTGYRPVTNRGAATMPGATFGGSGGTGATAGPPEGVGAFQRLLVNAMSTTAIIQATTEQALTGMTAQYGAYVDAVIAENERRVESERWAESQIVALKKTTANAAVGFLQAIGTRHRGAAIAALAIQKALAVKEVLVQSQVAAMRALAELGPIAGPPVAKKMLLLGKVSAGIIAGTGLAEAITISKGQGGAGLTSAQPTFTRSAAGTLTPGGQSAIAGAQGVKVTQVYIQGPIYSVTDFRKAITEAIKHETDRDVIVIHQNSRQASEIRRGRR